MGLTFAIASGQLWGDTIWQIGTFTATLCILDALSEWLTMMIDPLAAYPPNPTRGLLVVRGCIIVGAF